MVEDGDSEGLVVAKTLTQSAENRNGHWRFGDCHATWRGAMTAYARFSD